MEPLINRWAVWSDLIAPVTYSLHMTYYQLGLLESYLENPGLHAEAASNPQMVGGAFVGLTPENVPEVRELLECSRRQQERNIELAEAINDFSNVLQREAHGQTLESFYGRIPEPLHGYIELIYDYFDHPILRFFEPLLYRSPYYRHELQSLRLFAQERDDSRRFFLNTPRLRDPAAIEWAIPFESDRIDEFLKTEDHGRPLGEIAELLGVSPNNPALPPLLRPVDEVVTKRESWSGEGVRIRYFGHACVLIEYRGVSILIDPWISVRPQAFDLDRFTYADLPEHIDFALVTHGHHDHFVTETLLRLRRRIGCLVVPSSSGVFYGDRSLRLAAEQLGFRRVRECEVLDTIALPDGEIVAVPFLGEHADLPHGKIGYLVRAGSEKILFTTDSNCLDRAIYSNLKSQFGPAQTVFLGMECVGAPLGWLYGALLPKKPQREHSQSRRTRACNAVGAWDLLDAVGAQRAYVYALGSEPWVQYAMGLKLTADSKQMREASALLERVAHERGFLDAARLYGQFELVLDGIQRDG